MRPRTGGRAGLPGWLGWSVVTLSLMGLATLTQASTCPLMSQHPAPCGPRGTCHLAARRPILSSSTTQPPDPHMVTCSCPDCGLRSAPTSGKAQTLSLTPNPGRVPVVDHVTLGPSCPIGSLVAGVTYWCQGKPGGCSLDPLVVRSLALPCNMSNGLEVRWHEEGDYNSREIPCPSYGHGALEKKFMLLSSSGEHVLYQDSGERRLEAGKGAVLGLGRRAGLPPPSQQHHTKELVTGLRGDLVGWQFRVPRPARSGD